MLGYRCLRTPCVRYFQTPAVSCTWLYRARLALIFLVPCRDNSSIRIMCGTPP
jgi:hypothetical protein